MATARLPRPAVGRPLPERALRERHLRVVELQLVHQVVEAIPQAAADRANRASVTISGNHARAHPSRSASRRAVVWAANMSTSSGSAG